MATVLCDERISDNCKNALIREGFKVTALPRCDKLPNPIASHTDILLFTDGETVIWEKEYRNSNAELFSHLENTLDGIDFLYTDERFQSKYPYDAILNALLIGKTIFAKTDSCSKLLLNYAKQQKLKVININQGYPACTALAFGNSAITADRGMAKALSENGIRVTLISDSDRISLPPYQFGFIGGCSGVYNKKVYFLGNLNCHPDAKIIRQAITEIGYEAVSLDEESDYLYDLGGLRFFN